MKMDRLSWRACICMILLISIPGSLGNKDTKTCDEKDKSFAHVTRKVSDPVKRKLPEESFAPVTRKVSDPVKRKLSDPGQVASPHAPVQVKIQDKIVIMDNGILQVTLSLPDGVMLAVRYNNVENVLAREEEDRGYWDVDWNAPGDEHNQAHGRIVGSKFTVVKQDPEQAEISFVQTWTNAPNTVPLNMDMRFIMLRGICGFYSYGIYERLAGFPDIDISQTRIAVKLNKQLFRFMAASDNIQRDMPEMVDRNTGQPLEHKEAVLLTNPTNPAMKGEVDCKYQYSLENKDCKVHGWISKEPPIGVWTITPSNEFQSGGPFKQDLTSHVSPISLAMFHSLHFGGEDVTMQFRGPETWKKVYGPIFYYVNTAPPPHDPYKTLWEDAKRQMEEETKKWPYTFPASMDYAHADRRGSVCGRLLVQDKIIHPDNIPAKSAFVGLAPPGAPGSWQRDGKGYQFWTTTDANGAFTINNVIEGKYNLYASVPTFIGDFKHEPITTITPGAKINLGDVVFIPPRDGPTIWEIGIADRSAAEFNIPDPTPDHVNKLYTNRPPSVPPPAIIQKFRQYGLWSRYTDLYPKDDLIYIPETCKFEKDWFYAHVPRKLPDGKIQPTTWQIQFNLPKVESARGKYTLRMALAGAANAEIVVRVNDPAAPRPVFTTGLIGKDNAIVRHGIHGLYWLFNVDIPINLLKVGPNTIFLTQTRTAALFNGVMYDYLRLEG